MGWGDAPPTEAQEGTYVGVGSWFELLIWNMSA